MHNVFVYGTLKRGFPNHVPELANADYIGRARTLTAYPLIIGGKWFSPNLIDEPGMGQRVTGELFRVGDEVLTCWIEWRVHASRMDIGESIS